MHLARKRLSPAAGAKERTKRHCSRDTKPAKCHRIYFVGLVAHGQAQEWPSACWLPASRPSWTELRITAGSARGMFKTATATKPPKLTAAINDRSDHRRHDRREARTCDV
jgi:hypothetical protein